MKKIFIITLILTLFGCSAKSLPLPEVEDGMRGQLGIDRNINEKTIDEYLNREDSVYRDMRMLVDEADYAAIGGDSYLSGYVKGFEVVPYPYLCNVEGLPEEVGTTYSGDTLFTSSNGEYKANYVESMHILESLFPKDKYIFLMCGGGGYAGMTKNMLVALGWDETKIYNTGGYWYYEGNNKVETFYEENGNKYYDFSSVIYHPILFSALTPVDGEKKDEQKDDTPVIDDGFIHINNTEELKALQAEGKTFALYVYLPSCSSCATFKPIVKEFSDTNQIDIYAVNLTDIFHDKNDVTDRVSYTPSMFIFVDGEVAGYLDPGSKTDYIYYESLENLTTWINQFVDIEILKSSTVNEVEDCESGCKLD